MQTYKKNLFLKHFLGIFQDVKKKSCLLSDKFTTPCLLSCNVDGLGLYHTKLLVPCDTNPNQ